jgi:hypothetical protein
MRRAIVALLLGLLSTGQGSAVPPPASATTSAVSDPVGDWIGTLDVGTKIRVALHVKRSGTTLSGTADSPDQGAFGIEVPEIVADGDNLSFEIQSIDGRYAGTWDATRQSYVGTWTQGGRMMALEFTRDTYPPASGAAPQGTPTSPSGSAG